MKKTFLLFLLIPAIFLVISCGGSEEAGPAGEVEKITVETEPAGEVEEVEKITVEKRCLVEQDNEEAEILLEVPVLSGLPDRSLQERINQDFEKKALDFQNESLEPLAEYREEMEENGLDPNPFVVHTTFTVPFNQRGLLSINTTYYSYQGGAHGYTSMETLNLDINTGKILRLEDFFEPGEDYQRIILEEIHRQIEASPENFFEDARETLSTIPQDQPFYIGDGYIVVYFDLYYLAPYAYGMPEFKIPVAVMP